MDKATCEFVDFGCKKYMLLAAIVVAATVVVIAAIFYGRSCTYSRRSSSGFGRVSWRCFMWSLTLRTKNERCKRMVGK